VGRCGLDPFGPEQGPTVGSCEHDSEPLSSIKYGACLDLVTKGFSRRTLSQGDRCIHLMHYMTIKKT
jgi:hypothetical protein